MIQSLTIAIAIPMTPICRITPKSQDNNKRTAMVDMTETYMVNFTSPAARNPLLSAPEKGYAMALNQPYHKLLCIRLQRIESHK